MVSQKAKLFSQMPFRVALLNTIDFLEIGSTGDVEFGGVGRYLKFLSNIHFAGYGLRVAYLPQPIPDPDPPGAVEPNRQAFWTPITVAPIFFHRVQQLRGCDMLQPGPGRR